MEWKSQIFEGLKERDVIEKPPVHFYACKSI